MSKIRKDVKKKKDGSTTIRYMADYKDLNRKRHRPYFNTRKEASLYLNEVEHNKNRGVNVVDARTIKFEDAAKEFMELHVELKLKPSTIGSYNSLYKIWLIPEFSGRNLSDISPTDIEKLIRKIQKAGRSNKTVRNCLFVISKIYERKIKAGFLLRNPIKCIDLPKVPHREMRVLTKFEISNLLEAAKHYDPFMYYFIFVSLSLFTRKGETCSIRWSGINFDKNEISITKQLYKGKFIDLKTRCSIRKIIMNDELVRILKEYKEVAIKNSMDLVFTNSHGNPVDSSNLYKRFQNCVDKSGIKKPVNMHCLRHTGISLLIAKGVPMKFIQQMAGHSSIKTTIDRYGHLLPEVNDYALSAMNKIFSDEIPKVRKRVFDDEPIKLIPVKSSSKKDGSKDGSK